MKVLTNTASGEICLRLHHGVRVGIGYSIHPGMVVVADGTDKASEKPSRALRNDPGIGVIRHADAGYDVAKEVLTGNIT